MAQIPRGDVKHTRVEAIPISDADTVTGSAGAAATLTYAAVTGLAHELEAVYYSYSASPTGGKITLKDNTTVVFEQDVTAAGPGQVVFASPRRISVGSPLVLVLAAPGGAVVGKVNGSVRTIQ